MQTNTESTTPELRKALVHLRNAESFELLYKQSELNPLKVFYFIHVCKFNQYDKSALDMKLSEQFISDYNTNNIITTALSAGTLIGSSLFFLRNQINNGVNVRPFRAILKGTAITILITPFIADFVLKSIIRKYNLKMMIDKDFIDGIRRKRFEYYSLYGRPTYEYEARMLQHGESKRMVMRVRDDYSDLGLNSEKTAFRELREDGSEKSTN